jgi:FMN phosphatase YigB (HAD superfamily)
MGFMTCWINRRNLELPPGSVSSDIVLPDLAEVPRLLGL